ncbi:hypothetical protein EG835_14910, partial [bacterium]|nr:hypothetical protein [bacterium]
MVSVAGGLALLPRSQALVFGDRRGRLPVGPAGNRVGVLAEEAPVGQREAGGADRVRVGQPLRDLGELRPLVHGPAACESEDRRRGAAGTEHLHGFTRILARPLLYAGRHLPQSGGVSSEIPGWVRDAVFYQVFPDRFARSMRVEQPGPLEPRDAPPTPHACTGG